MTKPHVAVLMGGWSAEREVSLRSGKACADALESVGYPVTRIDVGRDIALRLADLKPDVVLNVTHGRPGEDGTLSAILEVMRIPYSHSGVMSSALAMDKAMAKRVLSASGIAVPGGLRVHRLEAAREHLIARPYVVKPNAEGSSIGVFIVTAEHEHPPQELNSAEWGLDETVLVEPFIAGRELTCAVMGDRALAVIEIVQDNRFYDYEAKYAPGGSRHLIPAPLKPNIYSEVQRLSLAAHHALGCKGVSRADFRYDDTPGGTGDLVCLEVNTQPGMTGTSLVPDMAAHEGISFAELVEWMVLDASLDR
ncbi:D-alanine--D-alanine ligase [Phreatobacter stygius]|uniref:D-alanine--D-alanine ligase n=1 Tax=Phreatobacter stygius TaxID=1940610 RepID=A0A4D7B480_9HYPH|nr:D-alanine--D-alanine ligase [Phreatobacter stygius]QCI65823.1 D-alanine--D-alanine ligase [Phreatobacter stygius]